MAYRFSLILAGILAAFGFLTFHLYQLQLVKGGYYLARAQAEVSGSGNASANRGAIYFTDNQGNELPVAVNQEVPLIYAVPTAIKDPATAAAAVAPVLNMSSTALQAVFSQKTSYALLAKGVSQSVADKILALNIKGVVADYVPQRFYPLGAVASQVLGYVGPSASNNAQVGHYGVEEYYNSFLQGATTGTNAGQGGQDLALTIDPNVQIEGEKVLAKYIQIANASGGEFIVEDPKSGAILGMGQTPNFDPNNFSKYPLADFLNKNIQNVYEPGSIMKLITMAAGIDAGKITPDMTYTDYGYKNIDGAHITNWNLITHGPYGPGTTMTQVIEHSINTGAIWAENQTGNSIYLSYLKKFGVDQKTGIDLPGEVAGSVAQLTPSAPQIDWDTAAYGQGVSLSSLELVQAISAIANGGLLMRPYLNMSEHPKVIRRVISSSTAAQVTQMGVDAVDLAQVANINGYSLAGKTGSAYVPNPAGGGYLQELDDSYIGWGPTSDPRFIAFIRLNHVSVNSLAEETVVPAWRELAQWLINYYNIPPNRTTNDVIPNCKNLICGG